MILFIDRHCAYSQQVVHPCMYQQDTFIQKITPDRRPYASSGLVECRARIQWNYRNIRACYHQPCDTHNGAEAAESTLSGPLGAKLQTKALYLLPRIHASLPLRLQRWRRIHISLPLRLQRWIKGTHLA